MSEYEGFTPEEIAEMEEQDRLYEALDDFLCSEIDSFNEQSIRTKAQLCKSVDDVIAAYQKESTDEKRTHADAFYSTLLDMLSTFSRKIASASFPEPLPDWWFYSYEISVTGIKLLLNSLDWEPQEETIFDCYSHVFSALSFFDVPTKLVSLTEYAEEYGVASGTVRQWIRRGKIRNAIKVGNEWRIPELVELKKNCHYVPVEYFWEYPLVDLPEKFAFLEKMKGVLIYQDSSNRRKFTIAPYNDDLLIFPTFPEDVEERRAYFAQYPGLVFDDEASILIEPKEREELEVYLIANPLVKIRDRSSGNGYSLYPEVGLIADYGKEYAGQSTTIYLQ